MSWGEDILRETIKTLAKVSERYYWLGMVEDLKDYWVGREIQSYPPTSTADCLKTGKITVFPIRGQRRKISPPRVETFHIHGICRLPDDGSQMVECHKCQNWFHTNCVRVTRAALKRQSVPWLCSACVYNSICLYHFLLG